MCVSGEASTRIAYLSSRRNLPLTVEPYEGWHTNLRKEFISSPDSLHNAVEQHLHAPIVATQWPIAFGDSS
ncbi:hypothetical protein X777_02924 [Ooceraea biroi]|uniref:Uncharacterized protein n=1 Tax=Ooceraea biroi TaxID=2015173 RepID=A0A026WJW9_OOCBI|nr:hypothetical protein X777_02924 [Ooceraea biroi]